MFASLSNPAFFLVYYGALAVLEEWECDAETVDVLLEEEILRGA